MLEFMAILYHAESLPSRTTFLGEIWWKITLLLYSTTAGYSLMSPSTCISFLHVPRTKRTKDFYETLGLISKHCYTSTLWFKASFAKEPPDAKYHPTCNFQRIRAVAHSPGYLQMAIFRAPWNIYKMILYYREKERVVSRRRSSYNLATMHWFLMWPIISRRWLPEEINCNPSEPLNTQVMRLTVVSDSLFPKMKMSMETAS